jgi:putative membrane protein
MKNSILPLFILLVGSLGLADVDRAQILGKLRSINQTEIRVGQLAEDRGATTEVKDYGRKIVTDHKKLDDDVTKFAGTYNVTIADIQPSDEDKTTLDDLENSTGVDFDKKFLATMIKGHEDAINLVKTARSETKDAKFKNFLATVIPGLEKHEATAQKLEKKETM